MRLALATTALSAGVLGLIACSPTPQLLSLADGAEVFYLSNTSIKPVATPIRTCAS